MKNMNGGWITLITIVVIVWLLIIYKVYLILTTGWNRSPICLIGKTAIVTGANTGIGFYTAQDFAKRGARVILACRDAKKAEKAKAKIISATGNPNILIHILDLSSLASIRKFVKTIKSTEKRLHILINNAGAGGLNHTTTLDGLSLSMQVNYFGPFLLTISLIDLLKKSAPSRIVNVTSSLANSAKLNLDDLNAFPNTKFPKLIDYANSKFCNVLFTNELARRLKESGVETNSVNPGIVQTNCVHNLSDCAKKFVDTILKIFYKDPEEGAQTSLYVAISKNVEGVSGEYFSDCQKDDMPKNGRDEELAKKLWEKSLEFVKLTNEETENTEETESTEQIELTKPTEQIEPTEPTEQTEQTEETKQTEETEQTQQTEQTGQAEQTEKTKQSEEEEL